MILFICSWRIPAKALCAVAVVCTVLVRIAGIKRKPNYPAEDTEVSAFVHFCLKL
jgi:hypothetical protein